MTIVSASLTGGGGLDEINSGLSFKQLKMVWERIPLGINIIDRKSRILYYNHNCSKIADLKTYYIGKNIESYHRKTQSREQIQKMLSDLENGEKNSVYYESVRKGKTAGLTVFPFELEESVSGFIQVIVIKEEH